MKLDMTEHEAAADVWKLRAFFDSDACPRTPEEIFVTPNQFAALSESIKKAEAENPGLKLFRFPLKVSCNFKLEKLNRYGAPARPGDEVVDMSQNGLDIPPDAVKPESAPRIQSPDEKID
jgi:hypothetical protein